MHICTVIGKVWATQKESTLGGLRLLVVRPFTTGSAETAATMVAVDTVSAGIGERVIVVHGRAARHAIGKGHDIGFQTAIVGIIDSMELEGGRRVGQTAEMDRPATEENARGTQ
ncbi:MAG: ethanolamine utilization protein EutN [Candidatus Paceibacteria bacterium]|jgi:ethanolamine utilization protein EutN